MTGMALLFTRSYDASASAPIAFGTVDRAVQCAIPVPGAWGSKQVARNRHDMLQTVTDRTLKPDELD